MGTSQEIWLPVVGYEDLYEVSNYGRVRSLFRFKKVLKWIITKNGYAVVDLFKDNKGKISLVHRLVATAFIENPKNCPQVNHKDENKLNNFVGNLEWVTAKENMNYGTRLARQLASIDYSTESRKKIARKNGKTVSIPVIQLYNNEVIARYESAKEASLATGLNHSHICECANGKRYKTVGGYVWRHEKEE